MPGIGTASVADVLTGSRERKGGEEHIGLNHRVQMRLKKNYDEMYLEEEVVPEVALPGYAAGVNESGIQHSQSKLRASADRLSAKLEEIYCSSLSPRLNKPSDSLSVRYRSLIGGNIQTFHCRDEKETWTYRCRCNFQILRVTPNDAATTTPTHATPMVYRYAMRRMGKPVLLGTKNTFPIATQRIQIAMEEFMDHLNNNNNNTNTNNDDDDTGNLATGNLATGKDGVNNPDRVDMIGYNGHLTSCTFSSAWRDSPDSDCVLTLHYDYPLDADGNSKTLWKRQARLLCQKMRLRQLNGRSKGTLLSVKSETNPESVNQDSESSDGGDEVEATIRDTIYLVQSDGEGDKIMDDGATTKNKWGVCLDNKSLLSDTNSSVMIPVHYDKPETAFYHPNRIAMTTALSWMLNRLAQISSSSSERLPMRKLNVLEMYCGCGAHTVAFGRSGLVSNILAVELDPRLIHACEANVARNSLQDSVEVRRGDAGRWAKEESRKRRSRRRRKNLSEGDEETRETVVADNDSYDVLLVDPPRQGLDEDVCRMAAMTVDGETGSGESCFRNILYVSCGHFALLRDLERLAPFYEVGSCAQMDLFPRTDSIETLVHLRRREQ